MKRILPLTFIILSAFIFTGCTNNNAKSIIGHTYAWVGSSTEMLSIYFSPSGHAVIHSISGNESFNTSHFIYNIEGYTVEICYDYSDYWVEDAKGTIIMALTYNPDDDTLRYLGDVLHRAE